jgi:hypothetical protein
MATHHFEPTRYCSPLLLGSSLIPPVRGVSVTRRRISSCFLTQTHRTAEDTTSRLDALARDGNAPAEESLRRLAGGGNVTSSPAYAALSLTATLAQVQAAVGNQASREHHVVDVAVLGPGVDAPVRGLEPKSLDALAEGQISL